MQQALNKSIGIAVIDCYATKCGSCMNIATYVAEQSDKRGILLIKVDVDQATDLATAYKIKSMPTFLVIKDKWNNVIQEVVGGS